MYTSNRLSTIHVINIETTLTLQEIPKSQWLRKNYSQFLPYAYFAVDFESSSIIMTFPVLNETKLQQQRKRKIISIGLPATDVFGVDAWSETEQPAFQQKPVNRIR